LIKHVGENYKYAQLAGLIKDKSKLTEAALPSILEIVGDDEGLANSIIESAKMSMGQDISDMDMENVVTFAEKVTKLADFRRELHAYLVEKMNIVAPNLSALIGEMVGARLIAHAGSLTNLSKYPASTVQILGAEKALFRYPLLVKYSLIG
jgi:nucleolar protein 56